MQAKKTRRLQNTGKNGTHNAKMATAPGRKSTGETEGRFARDPKGRTGQYSGAGNPPLLKK